MTLGPSGGTQTLLCRQGTLRVTRKTRPEAATGLRDTSPTGPYGNAPCKT